jgi:drug/metabolite transporter (DMT)-like permease
MSLECVFAAISGAVLLSERLTGFAILGGALILLGVVLVEAGPATRNIRLPQFWVWLTQVALYRNWLTQVWGKAR